MSVKIRQAPGVCQLVDYPLGEASALVLDAYRALCTELDENPIETWWGLSAFYAKNAAIQFAIAATGTTPNKDLIHDDTTLMLWRDYQDSYLAFTLQ